MKSTSYLQYSDPHIFIPEDYWEATQILVKNRNGKLPYLLGEILQKAALISEQQILIALEEQGVYSDLRIGEILALHGWIAQETVNFFAQTWPDLLKHTRVHPIGYYLQQASLLNEQQIQQVLVEQQRIGLRFGEVAVLDGLLKKQTLNFFLNHLGSRSLGAFSTSDPDTETQIIYS